ncbi:Amidase [Corchorus olitorius]|uniref:Amidase n=1 Tax=Corchorus olitorius TaxID=93759 RepID=A0A1R3JDD8_9ROSI|nr:Amidase [Corchorus olitorius]
MAVKPPLILFSISTPILLLLSVTIRIQGHDFAIEEVTIESIQGAFAENKLTSIQLVDFYLQRIENLNPFLRGVLEINPDAWVQAEEADRERRSDTHGRRSFMHGIPVLLKDTIATNDKMNTTAGSYALLGSVVARDAGVVEKLRKVGAIILGKASLTEWYSVRAIGKIPNGWSARGGQAQNPYVAGADPCGSSSGSAISVAANMVSVSVGSETKGSIICPADYNSVVGFKPTVGLTSRAGVIPISSRQDTIGPIARTVSDAVHLLDAIVGFDPRDSEATSEAAKFIPAADSAKSGEMMLLLAEFKSSVNEYLKELKVSPVKSLADIIEFNHNNPDLEKLEEYGQDTFLESEKTSGIGEKERKAAENLEKLSQDGIEKVMKDYKLDALVAPGISLSMTVLAIGGYPGITVPAGYESNGMPFGICFGGLKGSEPKLIELAYGLIIRIDCHDFTIEEATIESIQKAFAKNKLTSLQLVDFYLKRIEKLNPVLRGVLEVNPDARAQAEKADRERRSNVYRRGSLMHGIPVLLKDSIATKDKLNNTAGSYALLGSVVARDAGIVKKLRKAGAVILGKATLSEWYSLRALAKIPNGWSARGGQAKNPYVAWGDTCGSSSGSAISVAANMVSVSVGTETHGSILCPADYNSVVGFKPTVGLTSRAGVIPVSSRQDTIGPMARTVADAVHLLDAMVGFDPRDRKATSEAAKFIPASGYKQFLIKDGIRGKRLGVVRHPFLDSLNASIVAAFESQLGLLRAKGATIVDDLQIANIDIISDLTKSGELMLLLAEFKSSLNEYLKELKVSPVRSLADIIEFNKNNPDLEKLREYGQDTFLQSEQTSGIGEKERNATKYLEKLSHDGIEKVMKDYKLDALVAPGISLSMTVLAIGGYPGITVPAGYESNGMPFGICFGGLKGSEPKLIELAYGFEQATKLRKPPPNY